MCQPSPLGRCSADASTAYENAEAGLQNAIKDEKEMQAQLKSAHANYNAVSGDDFNIKYGKSGTFGSEKDKAVRAAGKEIRETLKAWDCSKEKIVKARHELLVKRMHFDTTPAGQEALMDDTDNPERDARLKIAVKVQEWQKKVAEIRDADGNLITSKKGKVSPEARPVFAKLHANAKANHNTVKKSFDVVNRNAIRAAVKARNIAAEIRQEMEDNPDLPEAKIQENNLLLSEHNESASKAKLKMRTKKLELVMYEDRMQDLSKIIQKISK